jgi:hypothetical protein
MTDATSAHDGRPWESIDAVAINPAMSTTKDESTVGQKGTTVPSNESRPLSFRPRNTADENGLPRVCSLL